MAKMFTILYDPAVEEELRALRVYEVRRILAEVDAQLSDDPTQPSRRRKLGDLRVFYDVDEESQELVVRAIRRKGTKRTKEIL